MHNFIHHTAVISPKAIIGQNNYFGAYCIVEDNVIIGNNNTFHAHSVIGSSPEHLADKYNPLLSETSDCFVYIGNNNVIREHVVISMPTESKRTTIGDNCYIMKSTYIAHDCLIGNGVIMAAGCLLAGHCTVMDGAYLGLGSGTHQRSVIGSYAMLGMNCFANKSTPIEPFNVYIGNPARLLKRNNIAIARNELTDTYMAKELDKYKFLVGLL